MNGLSAGHIPWTSANGIDISQYLKYGNNDIDIEVMGSPRNLLGPLHQADSGKLRTDWSSFRKEGLEYTHDYIAKPYGLFGQVRIYKE